jgi:homoserine kinase
LGIEPGFDLEIEKLSPVGSGLGSSASSTTAAVFALNEILGRPYSSKMDLLNFALKGESLASGSYHADNVAPSLLGGFIAIRSLDPVDLIPIPVPDTFKVILIHPHLEVLTKTARALIPQMIPLNKVTAQMGNLAGFIMGMVSSNTELLKRSFTDYLAVPFRAHLIPAYYEVENIALEMGALGCSISGSGPTVFALLDQTGDSEKIAAAMIAEFSRNGINTDCFYSGFNREGAILI